MSNTCTTPTITAISNGTMAFIRPVCVRADAILAAVMIISCAFIKVLRRKREKKKMTKKKFTYEQVKNSTSEICIGSEDERQERIEEERKRGERIE